METLNLNNNVRELGVLNKFVFKFIFFQLLPEALLDIA